MAKRVKQEKRKRWPITHSFVERLKANGKDQLFFDQHKKGFGVRCNPNGAVTFFLNYCFEGREHRVSLGESSRRRFPDFKVAEAIAAARQMRADLSGDQRTAPLNPLVVRNSTRNAPTIGELCDHFLHEHAEVHLRPSYITSLRNIMKAVIRPRFGPLSIKSLSRADIESMHRSLKATPYYANRCVGILSSMMNRAKAAQWVTHNPCDGIKRFEEAERESWLSDIQMQRLTLALDGYSDQALASAIRLILFTGARHSEVVSARWDQFDLEHTPPRWNLPAHSVKQKKTHHVILNQHALAAIQSLTRVDSAFLFPGNCKGHRQSLRTPWRHILKAAGLPQSLHVHDLRHSFASMLVSDGVPLYTVGKMLGHTRPETTKRYAHLVPEALQEATERSDQIFTRMVTKTVQ